MVYYKTVLDKRKHKSDGLYPIVIRVTFNRTPTTISTGIRIQEVFWDKKLNKIKNTHPNCSGLSTNILEQLLKIQKTALQLEAEESFTFEALKERLSTNAKPKIKKATYFNEYAQQIIDITFAANKAGTAMAYQVAVKRLMGFAKKPKLKFTEINYSFLEAFKRQLVKDGLKANAISTYFRSCRAIYNKAIKAKLVDRSHYAFIDVPIKTERTAKRAITIEQLKSIFELELKVNSPIWHARNYFILSFALRGISFSDLAYLEPSNIKNGRLIYKRKKTGQLLNIKLLPLALDVLTIYAGCNSEFLLPILPSGIIEGSEAARKLIMDRIKTTNKYLSRAAEQCDIDFNITTYVIRHTWATIAKRLGYSVELIGECLGHEVGSKTTNIYLDAFEQVVVDEVNEKVVNKVLSMGQSN